MKPQLPLIPELDYLIALDSLKSYAFPRKALSDIVLRGELLRVKKGLYVQNGHGISPYSQEILANMIYGPSYISLEYALSYYGLIPEHVVEITSVTTGKSKRFTTPVGTFSYTHLPIDYYCFGYSRKEISGERFCLIAFPEKALADRVMQEKGRFSMSSMKMFLFDNLRMDPIDFKNLDSGIFAEAARLTNRQSLRVLTMLKEDLS